MSRITSPRYGVPFYAMEMERLWKRNKWDRTFRSVAVEKYEFFFGPQRIAPRRGHNRTENCARYSTEAQVLVESLVKFSVLVVYCYQCFPVMEPLSRGSN